MFAITKTGKDKVKLKRRKLDLLCKVLEEQKIICLYLSKEERDNKEFREKLEPCYQKSKDAGYNVAVLFSGGHDFNVSMERLLKYNRDLMARNKAKNVKVKLSKIFTRFLFRAYSSTF